MTSEFRTATADATMTETSSLTDSSSVIEVHGQDEKTAVISFDSNEHKPTNNTCDGMIGLLQNDNNAQENDNAATCSGNTEADDDSIFLKIVGSQVCKRFGTAYHLGKIVEFNRDLRCYSVQYEDGDEEDLLVECNRDLEHRLLQYEGGDDEQAFTFIGVLEEANITILYKPKAANNMGAVIDSTEKDDDTISGSPTTAVPKELLVARESLETKVINVDNENVITKTASRTSPRKRKKNQVAPIETKARMGQTNIAAATTRVSASIANKSTPKSDVSTAIATVAPARRKTNVANDKAYMITGLDQMRCLGPPLQLVNGKGCVVKKIIIIEEPPSDTKTKPSTFLEWCFGDRIIEVEKSLPTTLNLEDHSSTLDKKFALNERQYELVSSKADEKKTEVWGQSVDYVRATYVATSGPGLEKINLRRSLEKIGDLASLHHLKAKARLELLQTPGKIFEKWSSSDFTIIKENYHNGCGNIPEEMLHELLEIKGRRKVPPLAVQVRIFCPVLGWFKGILFVKHGIKKIELPGSMRKVGPSKVRNPSEAAIVVVLKYKFPSDLNGYIGQQLSPTSTPPLASFTNHIKPLDRKTMMPRILQMNGVPEDVCLRYCKRARRPKGLRHAYLLGVADNSGCVPDGHVFVSGFSSQKIKRIFITRPPCGVETDGWLVPLYHGPTARTSAEVKTKFNTIMNLHFGCVVFGRPPKGTRKGVSLPSAISRGDLDGDKYFICWDDEMLGHLKRNKQKQSFKDFVLSMPTPNKTPSEASFSKDKSRWLSRAQDVSADYENLKLSHRFTGKLYSFYEKLYNMSVDDFRIAFDAYRELQDINKHGGVVNFPVHLRDKMIASTRTEQEKASLEECFHVFCER